MGKKIGRPSDYTEQQDLKIITEYKDTPIKQLADEMGITPGALRARAHRLGVKKTSVWTKDDLDELHGYCIQLKCDAEISSLMVGKSMSAIYNQRRKYGWEDSCDNLTDDQVYEVYKQLFGEFRKKLQNGFYSGEDGKERFKVIFKRIVEENFDTVDEIKHSLNRSFFDDKKLAGAFTITGMSVHDLVNECFPELRIQPWEMKSSSIGNDGWNEDMMLQSKQWCLNMLEKAGFKIDIHHMLKLMNTKQWMEYFNLTGMVASRFEGSAILWLEWLLEQKFDKNKLLELTYTFSEENKINEDNLVRNNDIYEISDDYYQLDGLGLALMNSVIRFCESNGRYPDEHDLRSGSGYISSSQYRKYFGKDSIMSDIHRCVNKVVWVDFNKRNKFEDKKGLVVKIRETKICTACGNELGRDAFSKYGNKCDECREAYERVLARRSYYKNKGIEIEDMNSLDPVEWYEVFTRDKMKQLPKHLYNKEAMKQIIRHVVIEEMEYDRSDILYGKLKTESFDKYRLSTVSNSVYNGIDDMINYCFINEIGYPISGGCRSYSTTNDDSIITCLNKFVENMDMNLDDILNIKSKGYGEDWSVVMAIHRRCFEGFQDMWVWYLDKSGYYNSHYNRKYHLIDFKWKPDGFWSNKSNRIMAVKEYCEVDCIEDIRDFMTTEGLKYWTYTHFNRDRVQYIMNSWYFEYAKTLYGTLVDAYPNILEDKILFEWEWNQCNDTSVDFIVDSFKQLVLHRFNLDSIEKDLPGIVCNEYVNLYEPKFIKHIQRERFENWYELSCMSFPEYADTWDIHDFYKNVATDGTICDSKEEMIVYEILKSNFDGLEYIGKIKSDKSKHCFVRKHGDRSIKMIPDFYIETNNRPVYIEYYGMYNLSNDYEVIRAYVEKTHLKNKTYNDNPNIVFIGIYPDDLKKDKLCNAVRKLSNILKEENK